MSSLISLLATIIALFNFGSLNLYGYRNKGCSILVISCSVINVLGTKSRLLIKKINIYLKKSVDRIKLDKPS